METARDRGIRKRKQTHREEEEIRVAVGHPVNLWKDRVSSTGKAIQE